MTAIKKKTPEQIREIRARRARGEKLSYIAMVSDLSESAVSRICSGVAYGWVDAVPPQEETHRVG